MSCTDLSDFSSEFTYRSSDGRYVVEIEKLGGGTVGCKYSGYWRYIVRDASGNEVARGQDLYTGTPTTHRMACGILLAFLRPEG